MRQVHLSWAHHSGVLRADQRESGLSGAYSGYSHDEEVPVRHTWITGVSAIAVTTLALTSCAYNPFEDASAHGGSPGGQAGSQAPVPFGELRDEMFQAMREADSVSITGEIEAGDADVDEVFADIDTDTVGELTISGALDGTATQMSFSAGGYSFTQMARDGQEYFRGEDFAALLVGELDESVAEDVSEELVAEIVADQWVTFGDDTESTVFSAEEFIATWEEELQGDDIDAMTGTSQTRDGEPVWVYTADGGESEFTVAASGEPYLLEIVDDDSRYVLEDWGSSEPPETPENVITLDDIFDEIADELGWSADESADLSSSGIEPFHPETV